MYKTTYDAWGNKVYTIATFKVSGVYETIVFYHEPFSMEIKRLEEHTTTNWFKQFINHYKMTKKYIWKV